MMMKIKTLFNALMIAIAAMIVVACSEEPGDTYIGAGATYINNAGNISAEDDVEGTSNSINDQSQVTHITPAPEMEEGEEEGGEEECSEESAAEGIC